MVSDIIVCPSAEHNTIPVYSVGGFIVQRLFFYIFFFVLPDYISEIPNLNI